MQSLHRPDTDAVISPKRKRRSAPGLTLAIVGVLWLAFLLFDLARAAETWGWQPIPARVIAQETGTTRELAYSRHAKLYKSVPHRFVVYQYSLSGQMHEGRGIGTDPIGRTLVAYYDPDSPDHSTIDQPNTAWIAGGFVLAVALIIFGSQQTVRWARSLR
jgi:Protein of unknown function (DUF3592)